MIKPGKLACAGLVAIMMVLPNTFWKGSWTRASVRAVSSPRRGTQKQFTTAWNSEK
jgi:hypothetical protein